MLGRDVPCLVDLKPAGRFLMEEFFHAGGLPVVMERIADKLNLDAPTVEGGTMGEQIADVACYDDEVIRPLDKPLTADGGIMVLKGNLAPDGAIIKPSAAIAAADAASRQGAWCSRTPTSCGRGSMIPISMSMPTACWCCRTPARAVIRGCRKSAAWRCPRSCWRRASPTWCGSPMRG